MGWGRMFAARTDMDHDVLRVLVVDDEKAFADVVVELANQEGFHAIAAYNAMDAIKAIETHPPHCVLLDIALPEMDGLELAKLIRQRFHEDGIVLIAITGVDEREPLVADTFAVVDHYFKKPIDFDALFKILKG
jgi:DNA-binding response OmpR family regulator